VSISSDIIVLPDNGGRRLDIDRRQFSYTDHIPDRRSGQERRSAMDRRSGLDQRSGEDRRVAYVTSLVTLL
jgi:hypothetical protein